MVQRLHLYPSFTLSSLTYIWVYLLKVLCQQQQRHSSFDLDAISCIGHDFFVFDHSRYFGNISHMLMVCCMDTYSDWSPAMTTTIKPFTHWGHRSLTRDLQIPQSFDLSSSWSHVRPILISDWKSLRQVFRSRPSISFVGSRGEALTSWRYHQETKLNMDLVLPPELYHDFLILLDVMLYSTHFAVSAWTCICLCDEWYASDGFTVTV